MVRLIAGFVARALLLVGLLVNGHAQPVPSSAAVLWTPLGLRSSTSPPSFPLAPDRFAQFKLAEPEMRVLLTTATFRENLGIPTAANPLVLPVPLPNGDMVNLVVEETPIMEAGLATQFPSIKAYYVTGADGRSITGRADFTEQGMHAMFNTDQGLVFIDPRTDANGVRTYISYYKSDYHPADKDQRNMICHAPGADQAIPNSPFSPAQRIAMSLAARSTGNQLSTYRLAVAATGEYTAFQGGTVPLAMSAIVTSVNRVNFIYERDVAVRMLLVANNNLIVYTNAATDPYTNNDGGTMLDENQANVDAVIGSANYDMGHVFSTGGGGVAYLYSPCNASTKAKGVTGSGAPIGDPFDIDYVAHEMGHQFGGNHTFNSTTGSCGGGNRNASTAWEPGSGTTVMAYAGICGSEDLQPNSDSLFHGGSINEIINFVTSGGGQTCRVLGAATGNAAPTANAGANYTIPANTPFVLTGAGTDSNGDTLTYAWDEIDLGTSTSGGAMDDVAGTTRPLFRSFVPSSSPVRYFPKLASILSNTSNIGERLPTTTRALNFRLTVRDQHGGVFDDETLISVTTTSGPFAVTAPNGGEALAAGTTVTWDVANTTAAPVSCANVDIHLSTDGGLTFPVSLLAGAPNNGSAAVSFPSGSSTTARLKVQCSNNIFLDISNNNFSYSNVATTPGAPTNVVATAHPGRIEVSFSPPVNAGSSSISSYTVSCSASGQTTRTNTGPSSPISVYGLTAGVAYACSVTATNGSGAGPASTTSSATALPGGDITPILYLLLLSD